MVGTEEGNEKNVEAEDGAGDAEDDEEGGFHWGDYGRWV